MDITIGVLKNNINNNYDQINEIRSRSGSNFEIKDSFCKDNVEEHF